MTRKGPRAASITSWLFVRTNVCGVGHCSLLLVRLDKICVWRTRWVIAGWMERTHRRPHVMKGDASRCPLCDWTGADREDYRKHAINSRLPQPAFAPLPQRKSRVNAKFVASIRRREHGAKVGGAPTRKNQCQRNQDVTHRRVWRRKLWELRQAPALEAVARVQKGARSRSPRASARHRQLSRE